MGQTDWDALGEQYANKYKDYAKPGTYKVRISEVKIHEVGTNGAIAQDFIFAETDVQYPKATHWLTFKSGKDGWRKYHNKMLMMLLGASEEGAEKNIDACEAKTNKDAIVKAYQDAYKRLAAKNPEVEIDVWQEGKYGRAEFADSTVRMSRPDEDRKETASAADDILEDAEPADDLDIPFN